MIEIILIQDMVECLNKYLIRTQGLNKIERGEILKKKKFR